MSDTALERFIRKLRDHLPETAIRQDPSTLAYYGTDWTRFVTPQASAVIFPGSTEDVQRIVLAANEHQIALVPSGGRTGLSGGAVAANGEVVVSMERLNHIGEVNIIERTITVGAGAITANVQEAAKAHGLFFPVNFASAGSSQIGGNIATNAGGINVIRYGNIRRWVAGLTVVTGRGDCLRLGKGLIKDATGYDLRHLFIGSEGTLGMITEAELWLTAPPPNTQVVVLAVAQFSDVMSVLQAFREKLNLQAFEFFSSVALKHVTRHRNLPPLGLAPTPYYVLIEVEQPSIQSENDLMTCFEQCVEQGWVVDGVASQSEQQKAMLWQYREGISESISEKTPYKNDIAVRVADMGPFLAEAETLVQSIFPDFEIVWFGHIGDGNLHLNILRPDNLSPEVFRRLCEDVNDKLVALLNRFSGSISAEHGVGLLKKKYLSASRTLDEIEYMKMIKNCFDPNGILNPGKIFEM